MTRPSDASLFCASVDWRSCRELVPPTMATVLVACVEGVEPKIGYWDGDRWYSTAGEPIEEARWWSPLPYLPAGTRRPALGG